MSAPARWGGRGGVARRVAAAGRWLSAIYGLDLDLELERFLLPHGEARDLLPERSPRSGVLVLEEQGEVFVGLYVDPRDEADPGTIIEETSHLLCLAWHAAQERSISRLVLELQGEVDRYAVARLAGGDGLHHFEHFRWDDWMDDAERRRYETAHRAARRYCRALDARFPARADVPGLLTELRGFWRASGEAKLRLGRA